jgi:hypothetical protein
MALLQIKFAPDAVGLAAAQATLQALRLDPCSLFNCVNGAVQVVADPLLRIGLPASYPGDPCDCTQDGFSGLAYTDTRQVPTFECSSVVPRMWLGMLELVFKMCKERVRDANQGAASLDAHRSGGRFRACAACNTQLLETNKDVNVIK